MTALSFMLLSIMPLTACNKSGGERDEVADRPDEEIERLMRSVADGNAAEFASMCDYSIVRVYPLRNIEDSLSMTDYFPILVDESLKEIMRETDADEWVREGWRGWTMRDRDILWYDEGVQAMPYMSAAEKALRKILAREEIATLSPRYRGDWTPVAALMEANGARIYRIDANGDSCRLMGFDNINLVGEEPRLYLPGHRHTEGSAATEVYTFGDSTGASAEYMPDSEPPLRLWLKNKNMDEDTIAVLPFYWRDKVKR